ncbi:MAG TPA: DUF4097 family beta strand repeat-containing protein [Gemmatimonadales bacterium]|nr:DUF4097 family beta strand repeat-containing protein [Gemmatimonadales bacterium]
MLHRWNIRLAALLLVAAAPLAAQEQVSLTGDDIGIWNLAGTVRVERAAGSAVTVAVTRQGRDAARLELAHGRIGGRETLRVIYPEDRIVYPHGTNGRWRTEVDIREDGTFGDGRSRGSDRRRVQLVGSGDGMEASADLVIGVPRGQKVAIYLVWGGITASNVDGTVRLDTWGAPVRASAMAGDLDIDTGSGDVDVTGMNGALAVDVGSGDVTLHDVRGPGLEIDTGSGDVEGSGITADRLAVDAGSGNVDLAQVTTGDLKVDTGSGDVRVAYSADPGDADIDTGSGAVTLTLPDGSGATVDLETSSGDIESAFSISTRRVERDALHGSFGDGRGQITVSTGSGDIGLVKG